MCVCEREGAREGESARARERASECVCVCVRACVHACVRVCVRARERGSTCLSLSSLMWRTRCECGAGVGDSFPAYSFPACAAASLASCGARPMDDKSGRTVY